MVTEMVLQVVIGVGTVVAVGGVNVGWRWAPWVGVAVTPAWFLVTVRDGQWGMFAAAAACGLAWMMGCLRSLRVHARNCERRPEE